MCNLNTCQLVQVQGDDLCGNILCPATLVLPGPPKDITSKKKNDFFHLKSKERIAVLQNLRLTWPISSQISFNFSLYHYLFFSFFFPPGCRRKSYPPLTKEIVGGSNY